MPRAPLQLFLCLTSLLLVSGCPQPLPAAEAWQPVEGAPTTRSAVSDEQRKEVKRIAMEARVRKMRAAFLKDEETQCTSDDQCELTSFHCCNCNASGQMAAVNKEKLPVVLQRRGIICQDYACAQVVSDHPSCAAASAVCREGKCVPDAPEGAAAQEGGIGVEPIPSPPEEAAKPKEPGE